ncbi:MAG: hypothetical protein KJ721_03590 [Nanoarchaeota archaeon]|nr:hypothetical protein [Nanoarchaeota archaeon]
MIDWKNKKLIWIIGIVLVLFVIMIVVRSPEDDWVKDSRGVWIKHGSPSGTPDYVLEQQSIVECTRDLYQGNKMRNISFSSQCLGVCGDYAVDVVHVPRNSEDNLQENKCEDYRIGVVKNFIELDSNGEIVRVVD